MTSDVPKISDAVTDSLILLPDSYLAQSPVATYLLSISLPWQSLTFLVSTSGSAVVARRTLGNRFLLETLVLPRFALRSVNLTTLSELCLKG